MIQHPPLVVCFSNNYGLSGWTGLKTNGIENILATALLRAAVRRRPCERLECLKEFGSSNGPAGQGLGDRDLGGYKGDSFFPGRLVLVVLVLLLPKPTHSRGRWHSSSPRSL